jgi:transposase
MMAAVTARLAGLLRQLAPSLLALPGAAELTAAKIVVETAGIDRFSSKD